MAISVRSGAGFGARRGGARVGSRAPVRAGAALDTAALAVCVVTAVVLLFLPDAQRNAVAATLRRTAVSPLVQLQREAEVRRARYLSYDDRVQVRAALARDAADATALRSENDNLRRMLGLASRLQWGFVVAEAVPNQIVGQLVRRPIPLSFMLTAGANADVPVFAPVIAVNGLVGMVHEVDPRTSRAISYADPNFRVSVQTLDGNAFGIVQAHLGSGADRGLLEMRGVPFRSPMKAGQLVVSSGQGGTFPRGIPVGTVIRELQTPERWARTYLLQPSASLADIGAVMVLRKPRAVAGVDSVWTTVASADSAARRAAAAGDSIARDALLREAAARRAALDSAAGGAADSLGTDSARTDVPTTSLPPVPGAIAPPPPADSAAGGAPRPPVARPTVPAPPAAAPVGTAPATSADSAAAARARAARRASAARAAAARAGATGTAGAARPDSAARAAGGARSTTAAPRPTVPRPTVPAPARTGAGTPTRAPR